jgi:predicted ATPase
MLLVLDNCEHLLEAAARLVDTLLHACPKLKVLLSSREALGITGESTLPRAFVVAARRQTISDA